MLRDRQCLRDRADQRLVSCRESLVHQRAVAADEIHTDRLRRFFENLCVFHRIAARHRGKQRDRCDRDPLVDDRDTVGTLNFLSDRDQTCGAARDFFVDLLRRAVDIGVGAVKEREPHRNGTDIEIFIVDHPDGFQNILCV